MSNDEHKEFEPEYQQIKKDLKQVLLQNGLILVLLVALYFINQRTGILNNLERLF